MQAPKNLRPAGRHLRFLCCASLLGLSSATLPAQVVPPPPAKPAEEAAAVVLSPFTVQSERDTGYAATSTLAGTRLNTPVKDLGASISIYTKDLITDIGATNANELLIYATGMEAAGPGGNFANATSDINNPQPVGDGVRNEPQAQARTRGLTGPNYTRGFFLSDIPMDGYNTDAVTVNRGPNAILFGVGSPAGVVDTTLLKPDLDRDRNKVEFRYGDNDSQRYSVDFNRVLIRRKLAGRIAALHEDERPDQRPAFENKRRIYGALTFEPFRSTSIRGSFESGHTRANRAFVTMPFHSISADWYSAGRPTFDWRQYDDPARNPSAAAQSAATFEPLVLGQAQIFGGLVIPYASASAITPDLGFRSTLNAVNGTTQLNADRLRNNLFQATVNRDNAADSIRFIETRNVFELPANYFPDNRRPAGIKMQGFTDYSAFDFRNRQIDETGRQSDSFSTFNVALEQRALRDRIGIELAYYEQRFHTRNRNSFFGTQGNANHVRIDPNVMLPDGRPNPNVGRPYATSAQTQRGHSFRERDALRATVYGRYDFKDLSPRLGRWLGRHTLTGLYEETSANILNYNTKFATAGPAADDITTNINDFNRLPNLLVYMGPSVTAGAPLQLEPIRLPALVDGMSTPITMWSVANGAATQADLVTVPGTMEEILVSGTVSREVIKSRAFVLQSYWLSDHLITTAGWRRDEDYLFRQSIPFTPANQERTRMGLGEFALPSTPPPSVAKEVKSYSVVARWPQKLLRLPRGTDTSVFYNVSENFTPLGARVNYFNEPWPSPEGKTREYGANLYLFDNRLSLRVNRFETSVRNQSYNPPFNYTNGIIQLSGFWVQRLDAHPPEIDRRRDYNLLFSALPANFSEIYQFVETTNPDGTKARSVTTPAGVSDTTDFVAKGTELELVFNPNRQWRLLANVANQETVQSNMAPFAKALVERMRPVWDALAAKPRTGYPLGHVLGDPLPPGTETVGSFVNSTIYVPYNTMLATEGSAAAEQRKWRANLVANYTFRTDGRFRGFNAGAGVRWQSKIGMGYPSSYTANGSVFIDLKNPYYAPAETNVDAFAGYKRKIWDNKVEWRVQLNVRNLIGDDDPIAVTAQPDGSIASARVPPERRWFVTNTFTF